VAPWHGSGAEVTSRRMDGFHIRGPCAQLVFGIIEHLACGLDAFKRRMRVAGDNRGIVEQVHETPGLLCQQDLLLGTLNRGREVEVVRFLEFLAGL